MKPELQERILRGGSLAHELKDSEGYKFISKKMEERKELVLEEALDSKTIDELRYNRGLIEGLDFYESTIEQLIRSAEALRKRIKK